MNVDYCFYSDTYGGSYLKEDEWADYSRKALEYINYLSASRLFSTTLTSAQEECVKYAVCALAEYDKRNDDDKTKASITSESVSNHSRSYNVSLYQKSYEQVNKERLIVIYGYLLPTNLLNRGLY